MGMDVYGIAPTDKADDAGELVGAYFRASIWSWRPIHSIIEMVNRQCELNINTDGFGYNDGKGLRDPAECRRLAAAIRSLVLSEPIDTMYLNLGSWCYHDGRFVPSSVSEGLPTTPLVMSTGIVLDSGDVVHPSHSVDRDHLTEFCEFLDNCGGFEIW